MPPHSFPNQNNNNQGDKLASLDKSVAILELKMNTLESGHKEIKEILEKQNEQTDDLKKTVQRFIGIGVGIMTLLEIIGYFKK